jgi:hypothetical protein
MSTYPPSPDEVHEFTREEMHVQSGTLFSSRKETREMHPCELYISKSC